MTSTPKKILVATDFSTTADRAEKLALDLARQLRAELHLLHVRVILEDPLMAKETKLELDRLMSTLNDEATKGAFAKEHAEGHGVPVTTHLVRSISAAEAITETATDLGCDLIVMGTHGRRGIKHLLLGSVAENVIRSVDIPVLSLRPDAKPPTHGPRRLLVAHDFSERSESAVRVAADWAEAFGAEINLLHVVEPVIYPEFYAINLVSDDAMTRLRDRAVEALDSTAAEIFGDRPVKTSVVIGRAADTIIHEVSATDADLVVIGTRGLTGIEQLVLGSVAEAVLRRCPVPLLTVSRES